MRPGFSALLAASAAGPATPATILAGLQFVLDAADVALVGGKVATFYGPSNVQQTVDGNRAVYTSNDANFNGQPSAKFETDRFYPLGDLSSWTQGEAFAVMRFPTWVGGGLWTLSPSLASAHYAFSGTVYESFGITDRPGTFSLTAHASAGQTHIYNVHAGAGSLANGINGNQLFSGSGYTPGFGTSAFFGRSVSGATNPGVSAYFLQTAVAYVAICNQVQTSAARAAMVAYLASKYGIAT